MRETIPIFKSTLSFYKEYILIFLKEKVNVCCLRDSLIVSLFCVCDSYAQHLFYVEIAPLCQIWSCYYKRISLLLRHQTIEECVYRLSYNFHHNFELKIESKEARIKRTPRDLTRVSYGEISVHSYFLLCSSTFCTYHLLFFQNLLLFSSYFSDFCTFYVNASHSLSSNLE